MRLLQSIHYDVARANYEVLPCHDRRHSDLPRSCWTGSRPRAAPPEPQSRSWFRSCWTRVSRPAGSPGSSIGPARRVGAPPLVGGPDVWEVARDLAHAPGQGMERVENVAAEVGLPVTSVLLAVDFYAAFPGEIDALIEADERAAEEVRHGRPAGASACCRLEVADRRDVAARHGSGIERARPRCRRRGG